MASSCIRRARPADLDDLVGLLQVLFSIEEDFDFDAIRQRRGLEMMIDHEGAVVLVAEVGNRVIGMCTGQLVISTAEGGFSLLVEDVVVEKPWRGMGIGTELLNKLDDWAEEMKVSRLQLLADKSNKAGIGFYLKKNWQNTELICLRKRSLTGNRGKG